MVRKKHILAILILFQLIILSNTRLTKNIQIEKKNKIRILDEDDQQQQLQQGQEEDEEEDEDEHTGVLDPINFDNENCHFTCQECSEPYQYNKCEKCVNRIQFELSDNDECVCKDGMYMISQTECQDKDSLVPHLLLVDILKIVNIVMMVIVLGELCVKQNFPMTQRILDLSQIAALVIFIDAPNIYGYQDYLEIMVFGFIGPIIPNFIKDQDYVEDNTHYRFQKFKYYDNILNNIQPLLSIYLVFGIIYLVVKFIPSKNNLTQQLKNNCTMNMFYGLFLVTFVQELLIIMLQFKHIKFDEPEDFIGIILAILLSLHIILMSVLIVKKLITIPVRLDDDDQYSKLLAQTHDQEIRANRLFPIAVMVLKSIVVLGVVFINDNFVVFLVYTLVLAVYTAYYILNYAIYLYNDYDEIDQKVKFWFKLVFQNVLGLVSAIFFSYLCYWCYKISNWGLLENHEDSIDFSIHFKVGIWYVIIFTGLKIVIILDEIIVYTYREIVDNRIVDQQVKQRKKKKNAQQIELSIPTMGNMVTENLHDLKDENTMREQLIDTRYQTPIKNIKQLEQSIQSDRINDINFLQQKMCEISEQKNDNKNNTILKSAIQQQQQSMKEQNSKKNSKKKDQDSPSPQQLSQLKQEYQQQIYQSQLFQVPNYDYQVQSAIKKKMSPERFYQQNHTLNYYDKYNNVGSIKYYNNSTGKEFSQQELIDLKVKYGLHNI